MLETAKNAMQLAENADASTLRTADEIRFAVMAVAEEVRA